MYRRALQPSHNARVRAFVKDLMAADEDEAELPARAARRPVVLMATAAPGKRSLTHTHNTHILSSPTLSFSFPCRACLSSELGLGKA